MTKREKTLTKLIAFRLPPQLYKKLEELAEKDRRSFSEYVRIVLEDHVTAKKK